MSGSFDPRLNCALFHRHTQHDECHCGGDLQFGVVQSCDRCDTDYCFTVVTEPVPGSSEKGEKEQSFLVFTSWKNLGSGDGFSSNDDAVWQAHLSDKQHPSEHARASGPLWPYSQYGKRDRRHSEYGSRVYRPSIHPETVISARSDWSEAHYDYEPAKCIKN